MVVGYKEIQKIDHIPQLSPVYQVSQGPSEDEGKPDRKPYLFLFCPEEENDHAYGSDRGGEQKI